LRIAYVTPLYRPAMGGVEMHVEHLATRISRAGHEVEVLVQTSDASLPPVEVLDGVLVRRFQTLARSDHYSLSPKLAVYLAQHGGEYDVIHGHNYHALPALMAALSTRSTYFFTPHYHGKSHSAFRNLLHRPYRQGGALIMRRASTVIAVAPAEAELIAEHFPHASGKIIVIPNGVDAEAITSAEPFAEGGKIVLLSAGRLADYKRIDDTIRALQHLDERYVLRVTGEGPERPALEALVKELGLGDRVRLLGRVETEELYRWFRTADVYVTRSEIEAMPITPLETLYAGARVVASDIPAHRGTATFGGKRVQLVALDASAADLAASIAAAAESDPPGGRIPTWQEVTERTLRVYHDAIAGLGVRRKAEMGR
jgi:glycosyltransferase involved in cell wall biosynthesis